MKLYTNTLKWKFQQRGSASIISKRDPLPCKVFSLEPQSFIFLYILYVGLEELKDEYVHWTLSSEFTKENDLLPILFHTFWLETTICSNGERSGDF